MPKTLTRKVLSQKVRSGDWVAYSKKSPNVAVAFGRTYESTIRKVEALGKKGKVVLTQVPPRGCSLIL